MEKKFRYLVPGDYMADPAVHVFDGKLYIYPSHDRESGVEENDNGDHFDMCDYHVFSTEDVMNGTVTDHGVVLKVSDISADTVTVTLLEDGQETTREIQYNNVYEYTAFTNPDEYSYKYSNK